MTIAHACERQSSSAFVTDKMVEVVHDSPASPVCGLAGQQHPYPSFSADAGLAQKKDA
jgi:hypothetical protein